MSVRPKNSLMIDTGFFLAMADKNDPLHQKAKKLSITFSEQPWITTLPVMTELCHMLPRRLALGIWRDQQRGLFSIYSFQDSDYQRATELLEKYQDREIDLADISIIILAEFLGHGNILSCDEDFSVLRWKHNKHFSNRFYL
ncbi:MAG: PIN domain-containing protein [Parachlamydia sp.]|nr:PIN domain-containing protein [Parachlamydia sp.]